ncbi:hypothetical protein [Photobacterium sp. J15]|uniref:hypothetical protein n=1 Tax=Photobacterium sp. J15 TaxID=265901 RepID=UPI000ABD1478|nr:hypothetical protein [Photobacterium sp. J15]
MRQGWCMLTLLLAMAWNPASAAEVTEQQVAQAVSSPQVRLRASALQTLYDKSDFRALEFNLSQLPRLEQEAIRTLLVDHAVQSSELNQAKADWLQAQAERKPEFTVIEQGDGYLVTKSAFYYGAKARGMVSKWQQHLLAGEMLVLAEGDQLKLSSWLAGDLQTQTTRRDIFISQLPKLSDAAVENLVVQFVSDPKLMWLPDNAVIAHLAAVSGDEELYRLLWRRRTDAFSLAELNRLAALAPAPEAVAQLMAATQNPSLKSRAYKALINLKPLPVTAREFLIQKLGEVDDGQMVALELAQQGHLDWLEQLASASHSKVLQNNFRAVQALAP